MCTQKQTIFLFIFEFHTLNLNLTLHAMACIVELLYRTILQSNLYITICWDIYENFKKYRYINQSYTDICMSSHIVRK